MMVYQETFVQRNQHRIYVREHPGEEPAIILMHGFPDNVHLYDRLFPTGGSCCTLKPPRSACHNVKPIRLRELLVPLDLGVEINRIGF